MPVRAIVFDAYGTLYDVQSVLALTHELCGDKGEAVTQIWRLKQLEYSWLRSLMADYEDFWSVTRASLVFALKSVGIEPTPGRCDKLMDKYLALDPYPDARPALASLAPRKLAILSNGSTHMLSTLARASGLDKQLDAVISVEPARAYKPDPACYALVERVLDIPTKDVLFVSSNGFDVAGAKRFGFRVAWVQRAGAPDPPADLAMGPSRLFQLMRGRAEELGWEPDHRIGALTDLASLL
jgi:2-haloacid dehalogenase